MSEKCHKTTPYYYGLFIVLALLPQILGFNGTIIDDVFKVCLIALLLYKTSALINFRSVGVFTAVFLFVSIVSGLVIVAINEVNIIREGMNLIISILLVIALVEPALKTTCIYRNDILFFYKIYTCFMLMASIYNMIVHYYSLIHITSLSVYNTDNICSFFDNKNTFGVFLIFGVLAATILKVITKQNKWSLLNIIFLFNELMAMCRTAIILSVVMIALSFFVDGKNRIKNVSIFLCILFVALYLTFNNQVAHKFIFGTLFSSTTSIDARNGYIDSLLPLSKGIHFWFGYGNDGAMDLAKQYTGNAYYHNGYLKVLISGGIFKLGLELMAMIFSVNYGRKCRRFDRRIGNLCILSSFVYIIYIFVESVVLFDKPVVAIMSVMFIISMPIMFYNCLLNEKSVVEEKNAL